MSPIKKRVIILGYHQIIKGPGRSRYAVLGSGFKAQLIWLKENGFDILSLKRLLAVMDDPDGFPEKGAVLTFDDGLISHFDTAFPILKELGFSGCFFIPVNFVGKKGYMGWERIAEMKVSGMEIGSHGLSHNLLDIMPEEEYRKELDGSKRILEERLGAPADFFSIPRGYCNQKIMQAAAEAGYKAVCTSKFGYVGPQSHAGSLGRFVLKSNTGLPDLKKVLEKDALKGLEIRLGELAYSMARGVIGARLFERIRKRIFREDYLY
ncbi:polysaccharide deacetylase family protein [Candidatus Omnitrophota bacterium]